MNKVFILTGEASGDKLACAVVSKLMKSNNEIQYFRYDNSDESDEASGTSGKRRKGTWGSMLGTRYES